MLVRLLSTLQPILYLKTPLSTSQKLKVILDGQIAQLGTEQHHLLMN
jgi:hypothetical protein